MNKIRLKIPPFLASMLNAPGTDWLIIDKELEEGATIDDLLADLASNYPGFPKVIFNPDAGEVSDQVLVILNDSLLPGPDVAKTRLNDGDCITLLQVYSGG